MGEGGRFREQRERVRETEGCLATYTGSRGRKEMQGGGLKN